MIVQSVHDWEQVRKGLGESKDKDGNRVICFDTETLDYGYPDTDLTGFSLGWYNSDGSIDTAYVPVRHDKGFNPDPEVWYRDLKGVLESPDVEVVAHNAKYDANVMRIRDIEIHDQSVFDTMIAFWMLNTCGAGSFRQQIFDNGRHGLKEVVEYLFDHQMTKLGEFCELENGVMLTHQVSIETMGEYAEEDVYWPLRIREEALKKFASTDSNSRLLEVYREVEGELIFSLADMEHWGIEINAPELEQMGEDIEEELDEILAQVFSARPGQDFEPVDPDIVVEAIERYQDLERRYELPRDHEEYPKNPNTGGPAGKGWMRNKMFEELDLEDHPLQQKIRDAFDYSTPMERYMLENPALAHKIFNPQSQVDLNKVLFEEAGLPPFDELEDEDDLHSTKGDFIDKWAGMHPVAENLSRVRRLGKLHGTYVEGILSRLGDDGRLRTRFNRIIATGRLSSRDPNLQNVIKSSDYPIRRVFTGTGVSTAEMEIHEKDEYGDLVHYTVANDGGGFTIHDGRVAGWWGNNPPWPLMVADYSQLELMILAHFSEDQTLLDTFEAGEDIHAKTAKNLFSVIPDDFPIDKIKEEFPKERDNAKAPGYGTIYGIGSKKLARDLGISKDDAQEIIDDYYALYPRIQSYIDERHRQVLDQGYVTTLLGRKRHIPLAIFAQKKINQFRAEGNWDEAKDWKYKKYRAQRIAQNSPIQGTAADIINVAMRDIRRHFRSAYPLEVAEFTEPTKDVESAKLPWTEPMWGPWVRLLLQVHDELVMEFHPCVANWAMDESVRIMESGFDLKAPLKVDAALGANWYQTKE